MRTAWSRDNRELLDKIAETRTRWGGELRAAGVKYVKFHESSNGIEHWLFPNGHKEADLSEAWSRIHNDPTSLMPIL